MDWDQSGVPAACNGQPGPLKSMLTSMPESDLKVVNPESTCPVPFGIYDGDHHVVLPRVGRRKIAGRTVSAKQTSEDRPLIGARGRAKEGGRLESGRVPWSGTGRLLRLALPLGQLLDSRKQEDVRNG